MRKFTTLLFDADNTLLDFHKDERQALIKTMNDYGVPATEENIKIYSDINQGMWKQLERGEITKPELKRTRFKKFFETIGFECSEASLTVNEHYLSLLGEGGNTLDGAVETVKDLFEQGYELHIVTNGIAATQAKRLTRSGLLPYIKEVFVSETIGYQKPRKEYFDAVLEKISEKDKNRILVIGDSLTSDIKGSMNSGLPCCWLNHTGETLPEGYAVDFEICNVRDVLGIVSSSTDPWSAKIRDNR